MKGKARANQSAAINALSSFPNALLARALLRFRDGTVRIRTARKLLKTGLGTFLPPIPSKSLMARVVDFGGPA